MKKIYQLLALMALMAFSASANITLPYSSGSFTDENTAVNSPNDDRWSYKDYGVADANWANAGNFANQGETPLRLAANTYYQVSDIWLVSPRFQIKKGNEYTITFNTKSQVALTTTSFKAFLTDVNPVASADNATATASKTAVDFGNSFSTTYSARTATFTADQSGEGYIALRFEGQHGTPVFIANVKITEVDNGDGDDEEDEGEHECTASFTDTPFASTITSNGTTFDQGWEVINIDPNSNTWAPTSEYDIPSRLGAKYTYDSQKDADDYLIAPSIHMNKGEEYIISYGYKASYSNEKMDVVASLSPDMSDPIIIQSHGTVSNYTKYSPTFTPSKTGDYYIAFHAVSPKDKLNIYVGDFLVARSSDKNPKAVTGLTATPAPKRELKVTLNWTNPTEDIFDNPVELTKIEVYRDEAEQPIATLAGSTSTYDDSTLEAGEHTYTVIVYAEDLASSPTRISTPWIGPLQPKPVPVTFSINSQDDFNNFNVVQGENSTLQATQTWRYSSTYGSQLTGPNGVIEDDWMITPPVEITEPGLYKVIIKSRIEYPTYSYKLELRLGTSYDIADFSNVVATITDGLTGTPTDYEYSFEVASPGTYYIGLHACCDATENPRTYAQQYYVKSVAVEKSVVLPGLATDVTVTPGANSALTATVSWTNPTETNVEGTLLAEGDIVKAVIYRNGEEIGTVEDADRLIPGQTGEFTDENVPEAGEYTYQVEIYNIEGKNKKAATEVTSPWIGPGMFISTDGLLFASSDLGNWERHSDGIGYGGWYYSTYGGNLEYYRYKNDTADDWLISPRLEFEPKRYYKIEVSSYWYTGSDYQINIHLGDNADYKDLPRLGNEPLINFVNTSTFDNQHTDVIYVCTSLTDDNAISTMSETDGEEGTPQNAIEIKPGTQRLAIGYVGTVTSDFDYYITGIKLTDTGITTGIKLVDMPEGLMLNGNGLFFDGFASVTVYDIAGAIVANEAHAEGSFDLSQLGKGIYIVTVKAENGKHATIKIIR